MTPTKTKKTTMATVKAFMKLAASKGKLYLSTRSDFDGMVDCVMPCEDKNFYNVSKHLTFQASKSNTYGLPGAWFVHSRNWVSVYRDQDFIGYTIHNCCGSFVLAIPRTMNK